MRSVAFGVTAAAALWVTVAGLWWGTWSAGAADSFGYISQSALWQRGDLMVRQPVALTMPWPEPDQTFAPLGYRPGPEPGTVVPIYAAGLPLLMALFRWLAGPEGVLLVVPLLGAVRRRSSGAADGLHARAWSERPERRRRTHGWPR